MPFIRDLPFNDLPDLTPAYGLESVAVLKQTVAASRALERLRETAAQLPNPRVQVSSIVLLEEQLQVSRPTASNYLQKLVKAGLMHEVKVGRHVYFMNDGMLSTLGRKRKLLDTSPNL